jgi:Leucine-rich repeat (LRR) protein
MTSRWAFQWVKAVVRFGVVVRFQRTRRDSSPSRIWAASPFEKALDISSTRVTDAGVEHLKGLPLLKELDLSHTQVGDAGFAVLKTLTALQRLGLGDTRISDAEVEALRKAMPNATIDRQVLESLAQQSLNERPGEPPRQPCRTERRSPAIT